jgi:hypothetical protein
VEVYQVSTLQWRDDGFRDGDYYEVIWLVEAESSIEAIGYTREYIGNPKNTKNWQAHAISLREPYVIC